MHRKPLQVGTLVQVAFLDKFIEEEKRRREKEEA
jgi:hypothetical protein